MTNAFPNGASPEKIKTPVLEKHREAMLDLILAWGSLDGALGMMLSVFRGLPMPVGAEEMGKLPGSAKIEEMIKRLKESPTGIDAAKVLKKHKKTYEKFSVTRNKIAHSHCAGYSLENDDYIIFAVFERVGEDNLAVDAVPIDQMKRATNWGQEFTSVLLKMIDKTEGASNG